MSRTYNMWKILKKNFKAICAPIMFFGLLLCYNFDVNILEIVNIN